MDNLKCCHFVVTGQFPGAKARHLQGFLAVRGLFPLHRCGGLAGNIVYDAVDALDLVDDAAADLVEQLVGDARPVGSHEVLGRHGAQGEHTVVAAAIAHDANGTRVGQDGEILVHFLIFTDLFQLLAVDRVGKAQRVGLLLGDLAHDANGKTRAGERLAGDEILGQPQLAAELTHLVLKEQAQRLDDLLEVDIVGKTADIVVALDDRGAAEAGLDHVGIDRALREEIDRADLFRLFLEHANELLANDLALALRLGHAGELFKEAALGVHADKVDVPLIECRLDLVALIEAHETMIDKNAGELRADGLGEQRRHDRRIHAAGERQQHAAGADLFAHSGDGGVLVVAHRPVALRAADLVEEVADHVLAVLGVVDFGVILHAVEAALFIADGDVGAGIGMGDEGEPIGYLFHVVAVAHPRHALFGKPLEELAGRIEEGLSLAVFARGRIARGNDLAAEVVRDELAAIADAEHGHARIKKRGIDVRRVLKIDTVRAAGEDEADGLHCKKIREGRRVGLHLTVNAAFTHAAGDQLVVLTAEVQDNDGLMVHVVFSCRIVNSAQ